MTVEYDVFISAKGLDEEGNRTEDSLLAEKVYHFLTERGLRVFFSNESLEQLGVSAYKEAIDEALDCAGVLVAVGTSREHLSWQWVRYEWDGFLDDIRDGIKPNGRVFAYVHMMKLRDLPRGLRRTQCIEHGSDSLNRLFRFIANALGRPIEEMGESEPSVDPFAIPPPRKPPGLSSSGLFHVGMIGSTRGLSVDWSPFCYSLGKKVADEGHCAFATNAKGVGRAFHQGAAEALRTQGIQDLSSRCALMDLNPRELYQPGGIRESFVKDIEACFIVGGVRGTHEEYEILRAAGTFAIPVGASGGAALEIWTALASTYETILDPRSFQAFLSLGNTTRSNDEHVMKSMDVLEMKLTQRRSLRVVGLWEGHWKRFSGTTLHKGRLHICQQGESLSGTLTVRFEKNGEDTVIEETLRGTITGSKMILNGESYAYVQQGTSTSYLLDNFELALEQGGLSLTGHFYSRKGPGEAHFDRVS